MQVACILQEHCRTGGQLKYQLRRDFVSAESVDARREFVEQWTDHSGSISTATPRSPLLLLVFLSIQTLLFSLLYICLQFVDIITISLITGIRAEENGNRS